MFCCLAASSRRPFSRAAAKFVAFLACNVIKSWQQDAFNLSWLLLLAWLQVGGGPRNVTDSWEHMWWDHLHWKRCEAGQQGVGSLLSSCCIFGIDSTSF
jgi:hypothetical protein